MVLKEILTNLLLIRDGINVILKGQAGVTIGVGLNGAIGGSGEILFDCPELEGCVSLFGQANVSFRPKVGFTINEIAANVLYAGEPKEIGSVTAEANAGARIGQTGIRASILMKGNNCPESCTYSLGGGTADIKIGIRISLLSFEILNPPDFTYVLVLWNGINGPC